MVALQTLHRRDTPGAVRDLPRTIGITDATLRLVGWNAPARSDLGVGAKPEPGPEVLFDGTREMLDAKWTYWEGPRFSASLPVKW